MKRIPVIMIFLSLVLYGKAENPPSDKDKAVACIKRWEGWHRGKMPYIGYGHRLLPHEKLTENLSEAQADSLLRCDLERCLNVFRKYGKDSLLLSLLGFNVGCYRLIGNYAIFPGSSPGCLHLYQTMPWLIMAEAIFSKPAISLACHRFGI